MTIARLLYRPFPSTEEGLQGYLLRVKEGNRLPTSIQVFGRTFPTAETICARLGYSPDEPLLQPVLSQLHPSWKGLNPLWNHRTTRYCPQCLVDKLVFRQEWELALSTCCRKHQVRLVDSCHCCGRVLTTRREALTQCRCGAYLAHGKALPTDPREIALAEILEARLRGDDTGPEHLQLLSLEQLHRLCVFFGAYAGERKKPMKISEFLSLGAGLPIVLSAADVLLDWPAGFHRLLERLRDKQGVDETNPKFSKVYGAFYQYLYTRFKEEEFGFLFHAFELHLEDRWDAPLTERNRRLSPRTRQSHVWVTLGAAATALGISRRKLQGYIQEGKIKSRSFVTGKGREQVYVDRRELPVMKGLVEEVMDLATATATLGLPKHRTKELIEMGTFQGAIPPRARKAATWAISRKVIELFVQWVQAQPVVDESQMDGLISIAQIFKFYLPKGHLFHSMIQSMIKNDLLVHGRTVEIHGMSGLLLEKAAFRTWLREQIHVERDGSVPIPEAARRISANQETTYRLVALGYLGHAFPGNGKYLTIGLNDIETFQNLFVFSSEIAKTVGISSSHLVGRLRVLKISPISGPSEDGGRRYLYRRGPELDEAVCQLKTALASRTDSDGPEIGQSSTPSAKIQR